MKHKITLDIQKIEQEKRRKRREEIRDQAGALHKEINSNIVIKTKGNLPKSSQVQQGGIDEDLSPRDEYSWIEHGIALHVNILETIKLHSSLHLTQRTQIQNIVE